MGLFAREYEGPPLDLLPPEEQYVRNARAARRTIQFFSVAVFVLVVGAAFAYTVTRERDGGASTAAPSAGSATTRPLVAAEDNLGPPPGVVVGPYLDERKQALAAATGDRVAVVSFEAYVSEADARAKVSSFTVDALLAAAPGGHPAVVLNGLEAWAKSQRQADELERNEIRKLLPTVTNDPGFKAFYESELVRLDAAIENASPTATVVFALVVRAPAAALQTLAATPGVRLVDVGEGPVAEPGAVYRGLRPEETAKAGQPPTRPV
ncbi:MAG: hypothetical protein QOE93_1734 [Actinomycetota bacterium]|nr:hypothetical protein [Actinomycetota bacterium]